jgi:hypothetical protein
MHSQMITLISLLLVAAAVADDVYLSGIMGNGSAILAYVSQSRAQPVFVAPYAATTPPQVARTPDGELLVFVYNNVFQPFNLSAPLPFAPTNAGSTPFPCVAVGLAYSAFTCVGADGRGAKVDISEIDVVDCDSARHAAAVGSRAGVRASAKKVPAPGCLLLDGDSSDEWWHVVGRWIRSRAPIVLEIQFAGQHRAQRRRAAQGRASGRPHAATTVRTCINFQRRSALWSSSSTRRSAFSLCASHANQLPLDAPMRCAPTPRQLRWRPVAPHHDIAADAVRHR